MSQRVAFVILDLNGGGIERTTLILSAELARRGYEVDIVVLKRRGALLGDVPLGVRLVSLGVKGRRGAHLRGSLAFARYLKAEHPDAVVSAAPWINLMAILGHRLARSSARLVTTDRNDPKVAYSHGSWLKGKIVPRLARMLYPLATLNAAVSDGVRYNLADMLGRPYDELQTLYNPRDTAPIGSAMPPSHPWLRERGKSKVILAAGRMAKQKDYPTLLGAFTRLTSIHSDLRLIIYGEGPLMAETRMLVKQMGIEDQVSLPGFCESIRAEMAAADLFVLSSTHEGLAGVLIEALAEGTPVVSTDCPSGPREILQDGALGRLVPVGDEAALAKAIEKTLNETPSPTPDDALRRFSITGATDAYENTLFG